eukprot:TRINITY_DN17507_c0_g1_i1.p1 TRINITY_DN17507_c0_g1~~TRINITY_DN17507_c0_g1_i1.p1  ORF type:complete len:122 (+),score=56.06 TRINITY_DN17507_c0_g1_i1:128-493(+)
MCIRDSLLQDQSGLMSRIAELEGEHHEHNLVIVTLTPMEVTRRCHRLVGGVLVEKTVADVLPEVKNSYDNIGNVIKTFNEQLVKKEKEMEEFMAKYKINVRGNNGVATAAIGDDSRAGVLV